MNLLISGSSNVSSGILGSIFNNQLIAKNIQTQLATNKKLLDPAQQGVVTRLTSQATSYTAAQNNIAKAQNVLNVAATGLSSTASLLTQMQDLATKANDATMTAADRAKLNKAFQSLLKQIDSTANASKIDSVGLLASGSSSLSIQTGITAADTTSISAVKSTVADLFGAGTTVSGGATVGVGAPPTTFTAIPASPTLTLNGIAIGNIAAGGTAQGQGANIAAAINLVSSQTGVTATADATTGAVSLTAANGSAIVLGTGWNLIGSGIGLGYSGNSLTGFSPSYFSVSPSGVGVNAPLQIFSTGFAGITGWAAGTNAVTQGANVAAAINLQTATTGVTATSSSTNGAITLTNTTGLPITIGGTGSVGAMTGLSLCPSSNAANNNNNVYGVTPTFGSNIAANAFQINGVSIGSITAGTSAASQAANVIAAINAISAKTGVTAALHGGGSSPSSIMLNISGSTIIAVSGDLTNTGLTNSTSPINSVLNSAPTSFANISANNITINGVPVGAVTAGTDAISQGANVAAAINLVTSQSGVAAVADITTGAITLSNTTGAQIFPSTSDNATYAATGLSTGYLINTGGPTGADQAHTNQVFYSTGTGGLPDISTQSGAAAAITSLKKALDTTSTNQSSIAADQMALTTIATTDTSISQNLQNTIDSIQKPDAAALQMQLQEANNQQSMNYYLINQMNQEAQSFLSIFR
jgi:flagellin